MTRIEVMVVDILDKLDKIEQGSGELGEDVSELKPCRGDPNVVTTDLEVIKTWLAQVLSAMVAHASRMQEMAMNSLLASKLLQISRSRGIWKGLDHHQSCKFPSLRHMMENGGSGDRRNV